jgi:arylsulfatase A-like enzyme
MWEASFPVKNIIVYTSDHGSHFRTRNGEYKRSCHEASIRIPMVVCGPGFEGGRDIDELVSLMDVPNTVLRMAGIAPWDGVQGNDMAVLLNGTAADWPQEVFFQISESHVGRGIRTDRWKYAAAAPDKAGNRDAFSDLYEGAFLYDLDADPHERTNLVDDPALADVRAELRERLLCRMEEANEPPATIDARAAALP